VSGEREAERRELEAAGWEPVEREGVVVWENPRSGYFYPQFAAMRLLGRGAYAEDVGEDVAETAEGG
jgi:hypothetical protein